MTDSNKPGVLIVEDDPKLAESLSELLSAENYNTSVEHNGARAIERIREESPAVVILDLDLPGANGFEVLKAVRPDYLGAVVMLTGATDDRDHIRGLELGADDYVTKPVSPELLLVKLENRLRHLEQISEITDVSLAGIETYKLERGPLTIDRRARDAFIGGQEVDLTTFEFNLLWLLVNHTGNTVSRADLYDELLDREYDGLDRTIDVHISRLRKKLSVFGGEDDWIKTVHGKGYQFFIAS